MLLLINVTDSPGFWVSDFLFKDFMFEDLKSTESASSQGLFSRLRVWVFESTLIFWE